jgi:type IV pilus biogenesis protein CpaD/CtpE
MMQKGIDMKKIMLVAACILLVGCSTDSIEGSGFYNSGKRKSPVNCEQVDPLHIRCYTVRK